MNITFGNKISVEDFHFLRKAVGWKELENNLALKTIENTLFLVTAVDDGKVIGLTRVGGDGGYTMFITDVIVLPEYQNKGIGNKLMAKAMQYIKEEFLQKGQTVMVYLMSAKGREPFYGKFGFVARPNDEFGAGMTQWVSRE
ncbi:MAG: GNAT family N-acetyltransferase [Spirochaetaceae bacterium]|nr:GNAT family N-acetyltransferase [Spirochaetaceae bacterium]